MFCRSLFVAASITVSIAGGAFAATIGGFDTTRTYNAYQLHGAKYDDIRNGITADGHTVAGATSTVTAGYLAGVDVFYTGMITVDADAGGAATASEISALQTWVSDGGTLVIGGENSSFQVNDNTWFNPFGLNIQGTFHGGNWAGGPDPLLDNGVAGSMLGFGSGGYFAAGSYDILATVAGGAAVVRLDYGSGTVIGLADGNFIDDPASGQSVQFFQNIMANAGVTPSPIPLPASLPMLAFGLVAIGALRRRRKS